MANNRTIDFFNLKQNGDSAVVRLLHTSPSTIESAMIHMVTVEGKKRSIRCCGDNCPLCRTPANERIFIHLIDYTDGKEKVWSRTPTILKQLEELHQNWGNLSNLIIKITRQGNEFPRYDIMVMPPQNLGVVPPEIIDEKVAYRFYMYRTASEITQFLQTGVMPAHTKQNTTNYFPKEQYFQQQQQNNYHQTQYINYTPQSQTPVNQTVYQNPTYQKPVPQTPMNEGVVDPFKSAQQFTQQTTVQSPVYVNGSPDESMFLDPFAPVQK